MRRVFGYGSLVNDRTHDYGDLRPARLKGWRRVWRPSSVRPVAFLSAEPAADVSIDGLLGTVPEADYAALDERERAYRRRDVSEATVHDGPPGPVLIYEVEEANHAPEGTVQPILLSYLEVVVEGYLSHFGPEGVVDFASTTEGWSLPVLNDREAPVYPRHTAPDRHVTGLADDLLRQLDVQVIAPEPGLLAALRSNPQV